MNLMHFEEISPNKDLLHPRWRPWSACVIIAQHVICGNQWHRSNVPSLNCVTKQELRPLVIVVEHSCTYLPLPPVGRLPSFPNHKNMIVQVQIHFHSLVFQNPSVFECCRAWGLGLIDRKLKVANCSTMESKQGWCCIHSLPDICGVGRPHCCIKTNDDEPVQALAMENPTTKLAEAKAFWYSHTGVPNSRLNASGVVYWI